MTGSQEVGSSNLLLFDYANPIISFTVGKKRTILVSLAHPKILDRNTSLFCFDIFQDLFDNIERDDDFELLKKGLEFTISVYTAANPEYGFSFCGEMDRKKHPKKAGELLKKI